MDALATILDRRLGQIRGCGGKDVHKISRKDEENELLIEVEELSDQNLYGCYQCGTCSAGCPFAEEMDLSPDTIIRYVILGRDEVLDSKTIWLCASCFTCAERCPRDMSLTKIMEALRVLLLRKKKDHTNVETCQAVVEHEKAIPQMALVSVFRKNTG
jgi:heterodisulfide reductase subunit C